LNRGILISNRVKTVAAYAGWQQYAVSDGKNLRVVDPKLVPLSVYLGVVGMPGVTAWYGLLKIGQRRDERHSHFLRSLDGLLTKTIDSMDNFCRFKHLTGIE
jgi:hypothetical protein